MKNKSLLIGIGVFLITLFLILPAMKFIGIPTFNDALLWVFGEPTFWSKMIVSIFGFLLMLGCFILLIKTNKREKKNM